MKLFVILSFALTFGALASGCGGGPSTTGESGSTGGQTGAGGGAGSPSTIGAGGLSASGGAAGGRDGGGGGVAGQVAAGDATGGATGGSAGAAGANPGGSQGTGAGGTGAAGSGSGEVAFGADRVIVTGVRATTSPAATSSINLHNGGSTAVEVTGLAIAGTAQLTLGPSGAAVQATSAPIGGAALFQVVNPPALPATLGPGMDLAVTVQLMTAGANLPAAPTNKDTGCTLLTANLTATLSSGSAQATVYGLVLIQANYEATLGQILIALGYKLNVGQAQDNWNPNSSMMAVNLPGVEAGTDEVAAPHFLKAGTGSVTMTLVARFSPPGVLPYGWYPSTSSTTLNTVGTMSMTTDAQTSDKARMIEPPLQAGSATTFDPGSGAFGIWVFSDQKTEKYNEGGNVINGDYDYSEDGLNAPANVHRFKSYPLKDASGDPVAQKYLVAVEEAGNGDYQDYVFVLSNVSPAP
ncbi:MAG TPA: hypothetical protein VLC06_07595 [Polyangia bacterium]|nr:hypothetical protein [Polyangia bacterium]